MRSHGYHPNNQARTADRKWYRKVVAAEAPSSPQVARASCIDISLSKLINANQCHLIVHPRGSIKDSQILSTNTFILFFFQKRYELAYRHGVRTAHRDEICFSMLQSPNQPSAFSSCHVVVNHHLDIPNSRDSDNISQSLGGGGGEREI